MNSDAWIVLLVKLLGLLSLVLLNALFVAAEFAYVKLRRTQLEPLIARGDRRAKAALKLVEDLDSCIGTVQVGITLCGIGMGAVVQPVFGALLGPGFALLGIETGLFRTTVELVVGFAVSTFLLIALGELVPKSVALRRYLAIALWTAQPLTWFRRATYPFTWMLNSFAQAALGRLGLRSVGEVEHGHSEEELRLMLAGDSSGSIANTGRNIVLNAFDLRQRIAREVMRPRREITSLNTAASIAECLDLAERTRYSRFPLCQDGDLDRTLGVVHIKDVYARRQKEGTGADLAGVAHPIIFVPETARLETLLQRFLDRRLHFAVVVDEYGSTVGMVTLENILEELVGQIQDEFDTEKPLVVKTGDNSWEVDGVLPLHELSDLVGEPLRLEDVTTASGLVVHRLGGFPKPGDRLTLGHCEVEVEDTDGVRVTRLKLTKIPSGTIPSP